MKGIIWKATEDSDAAINLFEHLVSNYQLKGYSVEVLKGKHLTKFTADNGDCWEIISARESFRGKKCNVSYIERGIPKETVRSLILPCTAAYPFRATTYFGEYGIEGDEDIE